MPMLQIEINDKEHKRLKLEAKKRGLSARKYAQILLFRRFSKDIELTSEQVAEIKMELKNGKRGKRSLAREYGISIYRLNKAIT